MKDTLTTSAARAFCGDFKNYFAPKSLNSRLWFHDILHTALRLRENFEDEQVVGIYQAVLLRTPDVTRSLDDNSPLGRNVTVTDLKGTTIPGILKYIQSLAVETRKRIRPLRFEENSEIKKALTSKVLNENQVMSHYFHAKAFDIIFTQKYGQPMHRISPRDLCAIPINELCFIADLSKKVTIGRSLETSP